ncbi:preprotein translocase subunit SecE [Candidatus Saccharibacteria bacterium]|nr:preprotein translocase subunit SecE [Candidatus Saccharibacteria bacterium]
MNQSGKESRKRNLREDPKAEVKRRRSPIARLLLPVLLVVKLILSPLIWLFKWLNRPVRVHAGYGQQNSVMSGLAKERSLMPAYIRNSFNEIKLVSWPTFPAAIRLTFAVFFFAAFFAIVVTALDWVLTQVFEEIILNKAENIRGIF